MDFNPWYLLTINEGVTQSLGLPGPYYLWFPPYLPVLSPLLKELLYTLQLEHRPAGLIVYMVTGQCVQSITLS